MVGFKRLTELCEGLFGLTISQGAISNMLARMGKPFGAAAEQIAATVRQQYRASISRYTGRGYQLRHATFSRSLANSATEDDLVYRFVPVG
jgi:hypothetical protein